MDKIKLMMVDDHPIVLEGLKISLIGAEDIELIGTAAHSEELFLTLTSVMPDVILLDLVLPGLSGYEITRILKEKFPAIKVIILSANAEEDSIVNSLSAGAVGYLTKDVRRDELIKGIRVVAEGEEYLGETISKKVISGYIKKAKSGEIPNRQFYPELSEREKEVVGLIAEGLTYKEIGDRLYISARTVEAHRNHIMEKLELNTIADLIKYSIRLGITRL